MKINILSKGKIIRAGAVYNVPTFRNIGLNLQGIIQLYKSIVELIGGPDVLWIPSESWIQRSDVAMLIVPEYLMVSLAIGLVRAGSGANKRNN